MSGVARDVLEILMAHEYRGNVRELENILEHAVTLERGPEITFDSLPAYLKNSVSLDVVESADAQPMADRRHSGERPSVSRNAGDMPPEADALPGDNIELGEGIALEGVVEDLERKLIEQSLEKANGNKTEAARLLGISFRSLRYRLKKYGYE